jgi:hypothetical protein
VTDLEQARDRYERAEVAHNRALKAAEVARNWCNDLALIVAKAEEEYLELLYRQNTEETEIITLNHE